MVTEILLFESHAREASLPRQAATRIKKRRDEVRQTTCDTDKRAAKYIEVEGRIFENLLQINDVLTRYKFGSNLFPFILTFKMLI
jgi:hypothetical protein